MREIKFRGKATREIKEKRDDGFLYSDNCDNGVKSTESLQRIAFFWDYVACGYIDPATVGQWTGLKDKNGVDIYEGDRIDGQSDGITYVEWQDDSWILVFEGETSSCIPLSELTSWGSNEATVIGNIHEVTK